MAARKPPAKSQEETPETPVKEAATAPKKPAKDVGKMVLVRNKARFDYVQPSTGIKIFVNSAEPTKVLDDNWVEQFVEAGLLERV